MTATKELVLIFYFLLLLFETSVELCKFNSSTLYVLSYIRYFSCILNQFVWARMTRPYSCEPRVVTTFQASFAIELV